MLRGELVGLRARRADDVPVLHAELYDDVSTRSTADTRPWRPTPVELPDSPFAVRASTATVALFSVVELGTAELAGEAVLWDIDRHSRRAHLGMSLRPGARGRGLGTDTVRVLCHYGFTVLGLHRLQVDTLAENAAMLRAAEAVGFVREGTLRRAAWVMGRFVDEVLLGLLADEWSGRHETP